MTKTRQLLLIVIIFSLIGHAAMFAQTTVKYTYNNDGSRAARHVITLKSATADSTALAQAGKDSKPGTFEEKLGEQKIMIYPNPTQGRLLVEIQGNETTSGTALYLYSLSGKLLISKAPATGNNTLDLSGYPIGTYVLRIVSGNKRSEWKVVKE
jgi:hypothetical protein